MPDNVNHPKREGAAVVNPTDAERVAERIANRVYTIATEAIDRHLSAKAERRRAADIVEIEIVELASELERLREKLRDAERVAEHTVAVRHGCLRICLYDEGWCVWKWKSANCEVRLAKCFDTLDAAIAAARAAGWDSGEEE